MEAGVPHKTLAQKSQHPLQGNTLDRIDAHNSGAVFGQAGTIGPIEFLVRHRHYVLFEFESHSVLFAHEICTMSQQVLVGLCNGSHRALALHTLICGVRIVEKPIHTAFRPHQDNVFCTSKSFPQLLIESSLQQQITSFSTLHFAPQRVYLTKVVHVQKHF
jgi:hypothetical protein